MAFYKGWYLYVYIEQALQKAYVIFTPTNNTSKESASIVQLLNSFFDDPFVFYELANRGLDHVYILSLTLYLCVVVSAIVRDVRQRQYPPRVASVSD